MRRCFCSPTPPGREGADEARWLQGSGVTFVADMIEPYRLSDSPEPAKSGGRVY